MTRQDLTDNGYEDLVVLDPEYLDEAIIGVSDEERVIYDYELLIQAFMKGDNMTSEEAADWIGTNTLRTLPYIKEHRPIIMYTFD